MMPGRRRRLGGQIVKGTGKELVTQEYVEFIGLFVSTE